MFSPKVFHEGPCRERILMTLLVRGVVGVDLVGFGVCAVTMYCSFRMSFAEWLVGSAKREGWRRRAYQDSDNGVVIRVVDVVGEPFDDLKHVNDEFVFN